VRTAGLHALNEVDQNQDEQNRGQQDPQGVQGAYWSRLPWHVSLMPPEACWYAGANWAVNGSLAPVARVYPSPTTCLRAAALSPARQQQWLGGDSVLVGGILPLSCALSYPGSLSSVPLPYRLGDVHERQPGTSAPTPGGYQIRQASKRQRLPSSH